jgi:hypothetical protein
MVGGTTIIGTATMTGITADMAVDMAVDMGMAVTEVDTEAVAAVMAAAVKDMAAVADIIVELRIPVRGTFRNGKELGFPPHR